MLFSKRPGSVLGFGLLGLLLSAGAVGCAEQGAPPRVASSSGQIGYAQSYPDTLQGSAKVLAEDRTEARKLTSGFASRGAEIKSPSDPDLLVNVVDRADEGGHSYAYASRYEGAQATREFWDDERGAVTGRVAAAAQSKVTEAHCENVDVTGTVAGSLREAMDRQLERRTRSATDVPLVLERNKASVGAANVVAAQKLADDIARASYLVNVALLRDRDEVLRLYAERTSVDATLQNAIDDERRYQGERGRTEAEKHASEERATALTKSRAALGGAAVNAEVTTKGVDEQIKQAQADYDAALAAVRNDLHTRIATTLSPSAAAGSR